MHFLASKSNLDIAKKLFDHQPPASARVRDKRGQYPLHRAAAVGSVPMVNLLLKNKSPLNATDSAGYTALHHAVAEGHGDTAVALLKAGAETDKKDADGMLALDLAPDRDVCLTRIWRGLAIHRNLSLLTNNCVVTGPEVYRAGGGERGHQALSRALSGRGLSSKTELEKGGDRGILLLVV